MKKAIVTLATGQKYEKMFDDYCRANWQEYCDTYDYELIGGSFRQYTSPLDTDNCFLWVHGGATDLGSLYTKEFARNVPLHMIDAKGELHTDGRASKYLYASTEGVPVPTNKLQYIIRHNAGFKLKVTFKNDYYRQ